MIVRILNEGQYSLRGIYLDRLNKLDNQIVSVLASRDEKAFRNLLGEMLDVVRQRGKPLPVDELVESDLILPSPDITLQEAKRLFTGEGLIPG